MQKTHVPSKPSTLTEDLGFEVVTYSRRQFADKINKSISTVKRLEKSKVLPRRRDASGSVYFTDQDVHNFFHPEGVK